MKLLVIGGGGREHALAWKLARSARVQNIYIAPGNGGTARDKRFHNVPYESNEALADFAQRESIAFTVVGPEAPLASGVVDVFRARGLRIFGPTRAAAQLESSKDFAKAFMQLYRRRRRPRLRKRTWRTDRHQGRRPCCRQGRGRRDDAGRRLCSNRFDADR
jgi:phosphoribosylamine-glycine ligase